MHRKQIERKPMRRKRLKKIERSNLAIVA